MLQTNLEEIRNKSVFNLIQHRFWNKMSTAIQQKRKQPNEINLNRKDGSTIPIEFLIETAPYKGSIVNIVVLREITERKRIEELKRDMERIMIHDLKNPIHGISSIAELIINKKAITDLSLIKTISDYTNELLFMIDHNVVLIKMEEGKYSPNLQKINLYSLLKNTESDFFWQKKPKPALENSTYIFGIPKQARF